jgi:hypothetical protein
MRRFAILAVIPASIFVSRANAEVLYSAGVGSQTGAGVGTTTGYSAPFTGDPSVVQGFGDDYTTTAGTAGSVLVNSVIFNGGVTVDGGEFIVAFYNSDGSASGADFIASLPTTDKQVWTVDFAPQAVPSSGYMIFAPVPDGALPGAPGTSMSIGQGDVVDVGSNNLAVTAATDSNDTLTTGAYLGSGPELLSFELQYNPVPEPTSLGILGSSALLLGRRRSHR